MKMKRFLSSILCLCLLVGMLSVSAAAADNTMTLREDWRLTSDLDLNVPEGETLIIDGQGKYYIYELPGQLLNSGLGVVKFKDTILYPATRTGLTSDQLMLERQPHTITIADNISNGSVTVGSSLTQAKMGDSIILTVTPNSGYALGDLTVTASEGTDAGPVSTTGSGTTYSFTMPASDVTVAATFQAEGQPPQPVTDVRIENQSGAPATATATYEDATLNGIALKKINFTLSETGYKVRSVAGAVDGTKVTIYYDEATKAFYYNPTDVAAGKTLVLTPTVVEDASCAYTEDTALLYDAKLTLSGLINGKKYVCQMNKTGHGDAGGCAIVVFTAADTSHTLDALKNAGGYTVSLWRYPDSATNPSGVGELIQVFYEVSATKA